MAAEETPAASTLGRGSGVRRRLVAVAAVAALIAGSGVGLDHELGPRAAGAGEASGTITGAWFCPHGGSLGWSGWVVMANPGTATVRVRLTELTGEKAPSVTSLSIGPLQQVYREVSAGDPADATVVEFFGGWIGAAAVIVSDQSPQAVAAERCESSPRRTWYLLDQPTGPGDTSIVVVMNPFAEDAAFDVMARTETRTIAPGSLRPYVLPARSSAAFRLNDIALEGPGEQTVAVTVVQRVGRVIAGGVALSARGLRLEGGAVLSRVTDIPAGGYAGTAELILANPGTTRADLSVIGSGRTGQRVVSGPDGISLAAGEVRTIDVKGLTLGAVVQSDNRQPICAVLRVAGPRGDEATVTGTPGAARAWLVLPALTPKGGRSLLVLQNPGRSGLRLAIQLLGPSGAVPAPRLSAISLPPGRTISVAIPVFASRPLTVVVRAQGGTVVAGTASYPAGGGYAAMLALPM